MIAILVLSILVIVKSCQSISQLYVYNFLAWAFISFNLVLIWLGSQAVESPYIVIGQISATLYFLVLVVILIMDFHVRLRFDY